MASIGFLRLLSVIGLSVWFTLIVPGHQRGQIRLPGTEGYIGSCGPSPAKETCCPTDPGDEDSSPTEDPVRHCAICDLVAKLSTPDALTLPLPDAAPVLERPVPAPVDPPLCSTPGSSRQRAPPIHI